MEELEGKIKAKFKGESEGKVEEAAVAE